MKTILRIIIFTILQGTLLLTVPMFGQSTDSGSESDLLPKPEKDAFASIQNGLKNSPRKKEDNKNQNLVQPDSPVLDRDDYELYSSVTSLLPDVKAALRQLEEVINGRMMSSVRYRPGPVLYYLWGNLKYQQGDYEAALEKYEAALEAFPMYRKASLDAGMVAFQLGQDDKAIEYLERGLMGEGVIKEPRTINILADLYYERGSIDTAITTYEETIRQDAGNLHAHKRLAWIYYNQEEFDKTLNYVLRAISLGGGSKDTYLIVARIYEERKKPQAASAALEQARFFDPESRSLRHFQMALFDQLDRVPEIIVLARGLLEEDDQDVIAWRYLADAYAKSDQTWEAISAFESLLLLGEESAEFHLRLATLYVGEGLPGQGAKELLAGLEAPGNEAFSKEILAFAESLLPKTPESLAGTLLTAVESWARSVPAEDSERILVMMRARYLLNLEQFDEARSTLDTFLKENTGDPLARLLIGDLESQSGNYIEARIHLERAALDKEYRPDALLKLGLLELRRGSAEDSLKYLAEAYSLRPTPQLKRYILRLCRHYKADPVLIFPDL